jgi:PHD/YefM family antitoxin component YafN of YafNO toxin-antitoxin module
MDLKEIKKIIEEEGGKIIVTSEEGPTLVIMSLDDYRGRKEAKIENKVESPAKVPKELESESLKIDDLPF